MLKRIKGNLINLAEEGEFDIIIHGCNCQNTMGSGIAKALRDKWPDVYEADRQAALRWQAPVARLGNFSTYTTASLKGTPLVVVNAYTQLHYLPRGIDHFEYESFYLILKKLSTELGKYNFGIPFIGMGLAGGDPGRILPMIEKFAQDVSKTGGSVTLVEYDLS